MSPAEAFWSLVGALFVGLVRYLQNRYTWLQIRRGAKKKLKDPYQTNDPEEAIVSTLTDTLKPRLKSETKKLAAEIENGHNGHKGER